MVDGTCRRDRAGIAREHHLHGAPLGERQLARHEVDGLNAVRALVDRQDARIAIMLRRAGFLHEAHAAMDLHAERGDFHADIGREGLGNRGQQARFLMRGLGFRAFEAMVTIERRRRHETDRASRRRLRAHFDEHALHIRVLDDGARRGRADGLALLAIMRISQRCW